MTKHKERPWKISTYRPTSIIARDASVSTYDIGDDKFPTIAFCDEIEVARYIVQAVNSHDELVAALEDMLGAAGIIDALRKMDPEVRNKVGTIEAAEEILEQSRKKARAALARAKGEAV